MKGTNVRRVVSLIVTLGVAIGLPLWIESQTPDLFTNGENVILGVLTFLVGAVVQLVYLVERAADRNAALSKVWEARETSDARLQEIRRLMHELDEHRASPDVDLFAAYFGAKLQELEDNLRNAVSKREVRVDSTMMEVTTWLLNSSFTGKATDVFRAVHFTQDNEFFIGLHSRRYFLQVAGLKRKKQIRSIRRLVVYSDRAELNHEITRRIATHHNLTNGYACRAISKSDFDRILHDYSLDLVKDFGIYGRAHLYKGVEAKPDQIIGHYSRDSNEISRFIDCFDSCWESAEVLPYVAEAGVDDMWLFRSSAS